MSFQPTGMQVPCPWCHHSSIGHSYPSTPGTKAITSLCQVSVREVVGGNVFFVACGCDQTGQPRPDPQMANVVLAPPPTCVLCEEFAVLSGLWCSVAHRDEHLAMAKSVKREVTGEERANES